MTEFSSMRFTILCLTLGLHPMSMMQKYCSTIRLRVSELTWSDGSTQNQMKL